MSRTACSLSRHRESVEMTTHLTRRRDAVSDKAEAALVGGNREVGALQSVAHARDRRSPAWWAMRGRVAETGE